MSPDRLVGEVERKRLTLVSRTTWFHLEKRGLAPKRRLAAPGRIAWLESELIDWIRSRPTGGPEPRRKR